jgi:hypothetical protein
MFDPRIYLIQCKSGLYSALLSTPVTNLTNLECDIMYMLSKDEDMQKIISEKT